jgi:hypothetical protein
MMLVSVSNQEKIHHYLAGQLLLYGNRDLFFFLHKVDTNVLRMECLLACQLWLYSSCLRLLHFNLIRVPANEFFSCGEWLNALYQSFEFNFIFFHQGFILYHSTLLIYG